MNPHSPVNYQRFKWITGKHANWRIQNWFLLGPGVGLGVSLGVGVVASVVIIVVPIVVVVKSTEAWKIEYLLTVLKMNL